MCTMKTLGLFASVAVVALTLQGCGDGDDNPEPPAAPPAPAGPTPAPGPSTPTGWTKASFKGDCGKCNVIGDASGDQTATITTPQDCTAWADKGCGPLKCTTVNAITFKDGGMGSKAQCRVLSCLQTPTTGMGDPTLQCYYKPSEDSEDITFKPGRLGLTLRRSGIVVMVAPDEKAQAEGVTEGWTIAKIDGQPFNADALMDKVKGTEEYTLSFLRDAGEAEVQGEDKALEEVSRDIKFKPGPLGLTLREDGMVMEVAAKGRAQAEGVSEGWLIAKIDSQPFNGNALKEKVRGTVEYTLTFLKETKPSEDSEDITITFKPGRLGLTLRSSGLVMKVAPGEKAQAEGVTHGWMIAKIDGKPFKGDVLKEKVRGKEEYTLTFLRQGEVEPAKEAVEEEEEDSKDTIVAPEPLALKLRDHGVEVTSVFI